MPVASFLFRIIFLTLQLVVCLLIRSFVNVLALEDLKKEIKSPSFNSTSDQTPKDSLSAPGEGELGRAAFSLLASALAALHLAMMFGK